MERQREKRREEGEKRRFPLESGHHICVSNEDVVSERLWERRPKKGAVLKKNKAFYIHNVMCTFTNAPFLLIALQTISPKGLQATTSWCSVDCAWKNLKSRKNGVCVEKCENDLWQLFNPFAGSNAG